MATPSLGAVCCYFNPCGYESRRRNFARFHENVSRSGVRLVVVELAFGDADFELTGIEDAIRLRANDVMWQKEALLNVGIRRLLDEGYEHVAWLDADIAFRRADWPDRVLAALDRRAVVQVFRTAHVHQDDAGRVARKVRSMLRVFRPGQITTRTASTGYGWAARASLLREVPLYSTAVVGGADRLIYLASVATDPRLTTPQLDVIEHKAALHEFDLPEMSDHRLAWLEQWGTCLGADGFGAATGDIDVFFHGLREHRGHRTRFEILQDAAFDPERDVTLDGNGCLAWSSAKPTLHDAVRDYFRDRREDGLSSSDRSAA